MLAPVWFASSQSRERRKDHDKLIEFMVIELLLTNNQREDKHSYKDKNSQFHEDDVEPLPLLSFFLLLELRLCCLALAATFS